MTEPQKSKQKIYDLGDRTLEFAKQIRKYIRGIKKDFVSIEDCRQLVRSSGSIGANYIEANESLSKKDFKMRIKIARKESKETLYWLNLLVDFDHGDEINNLIREASELKKILSAILEKSS